jgi:phospholipid/cholesterol/gamma-HCH transport system permease protein
MASDSESTGSLFRLAESVGRGTRRGVESLGFGATLISQSLYWLIFGRRHGQIVRSNSVFKEAMEAGVGAIPIVFVLSFAIGITLAMQGIKSLEALGAEEQVTFGVAFGMVREFGPLITGILIAGRSGSALAARLGTMTISQEIDALRVMGIDPVRYLVAPSLLAMVVMVPTLSVMATFAGLYGAGLYITTDLGMTFSAYVDGLVTVLSIDDVTHGLKKSVIFGVLITIVGFVDGSSVTGGAEGVGRVTTNSVVHGISAIIVTDMLFVFAGTR